MILDNIKSRNIWICYLYKKQNKLMDNCMRYYRSVQNEVGSEIEFITSYSYVMIVTNVNNNNNGKKITNNNSEIQVNGYTINDLCKYNKSGYSLDEKIKILIDSLKLNKHINNDIQVKICKKTRRGVRGGRKSKDKLKLVSVQNL